ncbi:NAD-dependent epimerase/dehydratase family protein [archaeon]|jgi:nucleoside-diphosphate-sugar epimerase|nr:NAD-dependent epimerase/dehydratase family protein [archaeon]MBT3451340.1 NAD-dependent epimerase/dehydratase family protein [archaeon]MBT6869344.1 NAD-dependent epimerase/dehydratase family protein [archaeon]MBT7192507.1 NAD-dependent epimerase/dehydratase family protein [archaeon]MBT7380583.1 NAD-dependent epimerase/dehydratase family protein [archaeon]
MEVKDILITGGTGFIGWQLAQGLAKKRYNVTVLSRNKIDFKIPGIKLLNKDIIDLKKEDIINFTHIFHFATATNNSNTVQSYLDDIKLTSHLLELINYTNNKIKIIYSSSAGVYGFEKDKKFKETDKLNPLTFYTCSKVAGEDLIKTYSNKNPNIKHLIFRISNVYGPTQKEGRLIPDLISRIKNAKRLEINELTVQNCDSSRDFIFIDDLVRYLIYLFNFKENSTYNLGSGVSTKVKEVALIIQKELNQNLKIISKNNPNHNCLNIDKLDTEEEIKTLPNQFNLKEGISIILNYGK